MDSRLNAFLERAESVLARIEPLLPAPRPVIDWSTCLAARWQRDGRSGYLLPLEVSLDMRLSDLIGVDRQLEQLGRNTQQFLDGMPANHALALGLARYRQIVAGAGACWPNTPRRVCA